MTSNRLQVTVRTPRETVVDTLVRSLRVPTLTGQVGLRFGSEPSVIAVEPGLILLKSDRGTRCAGTAGGLLYQDRNSANLLTPLAVVGDDAASVTRQLNKLLASPNEEMELRRTLGRLQTRILHELRDGDDTVGYDIHNE